jgi:hypothetical protein
VGKNDQVKKTNAEHLGHDCTQESQGMRDLKAAIKEMKNEALG